MKMLAISLCLFLNTGNVLAQEGFQGFLDLRPVECQKVRACSLANDLFYTDPEGLVWKANAGNVTDGASIPTWAQAFIGDPYDPKFIKPAIVHDHYSNTDNGRHVRGWRETHLMFYNALLNQGVSEGKAKLMYFAVYLGGPKWRDTIVGINCGQNCINAKEKKTVTKIKAPDFDQATFQSNLKKAEALIVTTDSKVDIKDLEKLAQSLRPNDEFYANPSVVDTTIDPSKQQ